LGKKREDGIDVFCVLNQQPNEEEKPREREREKKGRKT
jgi:hypothetical protein